MGGRRKKSKRGGHGGDPDFEDGHIDLDLDPEQRWDQHWVNEEGSQMDSDGFEIGTNGSQSGPEDFDGDFEEYD